MAASGLLAQSACCWSCRSLIPTGFHERAAPKRHWRLAILFYGVSALGNLLIAVPASLNGVFVDATGRSWIISSILGASRLISVFLMVPLAVLAWIRTPRFGGVLLPRPSLDIKDI